MKNLIPGILTLSLLVWTFSVYGTPAVHDAPFGSWGLPGQSGEVLPGEGEDGDTTAFALAEPEQREALTQTEQESPITVGIKQTAEDKTPAWEYMLYGAAITLGIEVIGALVVAIVFWLKTTRRDGR